MANYSDDDDFENFSEEEFDELLKTGNTDPIAVNVTSKSNGSISQQSFNENEFMDEFGNRNDDVNLLMDDSENELELHGRGERMKLSRKPPEVLLRQYQHQIPNSIEAGNYQLAIEDLVRCTALSRIVYGDLHWKFAKSEADLAHAYLRHRSMAPQAQQHAEEARNIMLRVVQTGEAQEDRKHIYRTLLSVYVTLGEAYNIQQKFTDAELCYQKAEKILTEQNKLQQKAQTNDELEENNELKCDLRVAQGKLAANQNKAASAIAHFEDAMALIQAEYGDDSLKLIPLYQMVGRVEQSREGANHLKSIDAYLQAHSIANANYSEGTEELAETGYQLALAYARAASVEGDAETSAESYLNESLATYQSIHGPNHEKTLKCQDELARLMIRTERADEAIELLKSTLTAKRQTHGEHSPSLASTHKLLGSVHMSQGNMERALKSMNKELGEAEEQYRALQHQHLQRLQDALDEKDKQIASSTTLFEQLKEDFKYNLRLLQERDEELEQNDTTIGQLREGLDQQLHAASQLGVKLHEAEERCKKLEEDANSKEKFYQKRMEAERSESARNVKDRLEAFERQRLDWESERRSLDEKLKLVKELRVREKHEAQVVFDDQMSRQEFDWKTRVEELESNLLAQQLRVASLTAETEQLRDDRLLKGQAVENSEATQRSLENEIKQCKWELEDYRAMCTRRIQDLELQLSYRETSQKSLVEKYERKLVQAEARLQETSERNEKILVDHQDRLTNLNHIIHTLKDDISDKETEVSRLEWKLEDLTKEKVKIIEENAVAKNKLEEQLKKLESDNNSRILQEEINHLKKSIDRTKQDLKARTTDIENYQSELAKANEKLLEGERQRARLELDCQQKCDQAQREQHDKSEKLISRLSVAKEHAEALNKRFEKEVQTHQQAITSLKKELADAYGTLRAHGLNVTITQPSSIYQASDNKSELNILREQNANLKNVIAQMRMEMESIANNHVKGTVVSRKQDEIYVKSLEQEIRELKQQYRENERNSAKAACSISEIINAVNSGDDSALKEVIAALNSSIGLLRSEKVELTATCRKQQVEIESLKAEMKKLSALPKSAQVELDQAKYELNSVTRRHQTDTASFKQRISDLEVQLESSREEAAEYHKNLLTSNTELEQLSTELSALKMSHARSGNVINYGAQELVIQNLQDENERLRNLLKSGENSSGKGNELTRALSRITQLSKEKIVLTELSNRLRSELTKAGICLTKPHVPSNRLDSKVSRAVSSKLDELENLQYEYMKTNIAQASLTPLHKNASKTNAPGSPPTKQKTKIVLKGKCKGQPDHFPHFIEQSSTSSSSFKAKGKPIHPQSRLRKPSNVYEAPSLKTRQKSNIAWMKSSAAKADPKVRESVSVVAVEDQPNSSAEPLRRDVHDSALDSIELGSSIQDVWKLLDEQPSLNSNTPR
ncbi:myosin heavy chain, cardiac muscle isoform-like [Watersipora subatra]|uniref:myosin heavy chain, cardiac muscle isoform-like n=1 Tax=Watersipora subatra TaxID=2589382 RepID=UPI00355B05FF